MKFIFIFIFVFLFSARLAFANHFNAVSGRVEVVKFAENKPVDKQTYRFSKLYNKIRLDYNSKTYYIVDISNDNLCIVNKTSLVSINMKSLMSVIPPPLFIFENELSARKLAGEKGLKIYFLNKKKSNKIKVVKFKYFDSEYILFFKQGQNLAQKLEIFNPKLRLNVSITKLKQEFPRKLAKDFKLPTNLKKTNIKLLIKYPG